MIQVMLRVGCGSCKARYDLALGLAAVRELLLGDQLRGVPLPAPDGWVVDGVHAYCPEHVPPGPGTLEPTPEVLRRAAALQALASDPNTTEHERENAWGQFEKLWRRYRLPPDLGLR